MQEGKSPRKTLCLLTAFLLSLLRKEFSSDNSKNCHFMKFVVEVNKLVIIIHFNLSTFHKASHHPNCH